MKRATISLPEDLEAQVEEYLAGREAPPSLTALVQAALRRYLADRRLGLDEGPALGRSAPRSGIGVAPSVLIGPAGSRLEDLPALLASLPRLSESQAEELAADLDRAREELARKELTDPWSRPASGGGSATGSA